MISRAIANKNFLDSTTMKTRKLDNNFVLRYFYLDTVETIFKISHDYSYGADSCNYSSQADYFSDRG